MIRIALIRHSKTKGNINGRYIGKTDESLSSEGIILAQNKEFPSAIQVYSSPLKRCIETSKIIYSNCEPMIFDDLKECDFGDFENKNYKELDGNEDYQNWIDSNGTMPFPNGENTEDFKARSIRGFNKVIKNIIYSKINNAAMIVHGGTIMSILDRYSYPNRDFYCWQVDNCCGYLVEIDEVLWIKNDKKINVLALI